MFQLERLKVVDETLKQLSDEIREGRCDEDNKEVLRGAIRCEEASRQLRDIVFKTFHKEWEEEANEHS